MSDMRTPLGKVRGLGAAREGTGNFWRIRVTSIALIPLSMFVVGWVFQFIGHYVEGKPPEFFKDWRFLLVGLRWWFAKLKGRA